MAQQTSKSLRCRLGFAILRCHHPGHPGAKNAFNGFSRLAPTKALKYDEGDERRQQLEALTVPHLKAKLRLAGLPVSGRKATLIDRLVGPGLGENNVAKVGSLGSKKVPMVKQAKEVRKENRSPISRDPTPRRSAPPFVDSVESDVLRAISWNVNGLRALLRSPTPLENLIATERPHVLALQETKLQESHVEECQAAVLAIGAKAGIEYDAHWSCSVARKGYSGVAIFVDRRLPRSYKVLDGIGLPEADAEGRTLTLVWPHDQKDGFLVEGGLAFVNSYVPNSGDGLKRLAFRTEVWDPAFAKHVDSLAAPSSAYSPSSKSLEGVRRTNPVLVCGDLNVVGADLDFYNPHEKRMEKSAGTTPEERGSFRRLLLSPTLMDQAQGSATEATPVGIWADSFRWVHGPQVSGVHSYWSMRARNRPVNRGLRIDYFLASPALVSGMVPALVDAFVLDDPPEHGGFGGSDHCPVGAHISVPQGFFGRAG
eukprot:CAMPEP_0172586804 /NCGR_PEP_ID=MMETSP1068-20121228/6057_1 /TAXON_ID=35684 /ORGANISM="Pseudopedinella elastica, Strain CCMP716" /LENGTH=482 /DNA_ID=CAMNT_0013381679 /DNA_START=65 /DNA_END=1513 /DNA_ORIENTATION=-